MSGNGSASWHWSPFLILSYFLLMPLREAVPLPQNPMEMIGMGAMTIMGSVADVFQNGGAARKEHDFELPFASAHSKSEVGMGNAMRPSQSSDEDSDEDRRRRRRRSIVNELMGESAMLAIPPAESLNHNHLHRGKRSPCHTGTGSYGGGTGGTGAGTSGGGNPSIPSEDDIDQVERRRRAKQRNAAQKKRSKSTGKTSRKGGRSKTKSKSRTKKIVSRRRRRQTEVDDLEGNSGSNPLAAKAQQIANKVKGFFDSFMKGMSDIVQTVKQKIVGGANGSGTNPNVEEI